MEKKLTILIVDDSSTSRMIIKRCFDIAGYGESSFFYAADGEQALTTIRSERIDLVVTDLIMPKCDGVSLLKQLRREPERNGNLRVIIVSSVPHHPALQEIPENDVAGIVHKPVTPQKILDVMGV